MHVYFSSLWNNSQENHELMTETIPLRNVVTVDFAAFTTCREMPMIDPKSFRSLSS